MSESFQDTIDRQRDQIAFMQAQLEGERKNIAGWIAARDANLKRAEFADRQLDEVLAGCRETNARAIAAEAKLAEAVAAAREDALEDAAAIFDKKAALHATDAVWMGRERQRYEGARIPGVEMAPMNGPAISHDGALVNAKAIRALAAVDTAAQGMVRIMALEYDLARAREAIELILPLAKGYAANHNVHSNGDYIAFAESCRSKVTDATITKGAQ